MFEDFSEGYLAHNQPVIVFEIHSMFYKENKGLDFIRDILNRNGYSYRRIAGNLVCFPPRLSN